ncbi:MAG: hypothetical protein CL831_00460 [Crocinitomicaceae bacterium]|nr:hypothetical protein [Crocinitomicaceae bacterium]
MARTQSRSLQERENQTREEVYTFEEEDALAISEDIKARFLNQGMVLRWIRIQIRGADDYQNVGKRQRDGWVFVTPDEVPELSTSSIVKEGGRYAGTVVRGDVALAKMPEGRAIARTEHYENKAQNLMNAVNSQLMSNNDSRMPIYNNSKSTVSRGKSPKFQD